MMDFDKEVMLEEGHLYTLYQSVVLELTLEELHVLLFSSLRKNFELHLMILFNIFLSVRQDLN
jgi:hypothetical protein